MPDILPKSSLQFDLLAPVNQGKYTDWSRMGFCVARLAKGTDIAKYNEKISKPQSLICFGNRPIQFRLLSLKDFYFDKAVSSVSAAFQRGNKDHITVLSVVACMLLLVGIFNFINIYTVIILKRAREFGVKKVYGASGFQIFSQIYAENVCMVAVALLIIWMIVEVTAGMFASVYDIPVKSDVSFDLLLSFILLLGLPLVTSLFPFLRYNYSSPITSLRSVSVGGHSIVSRALFLFIQYVITFSLIVIALFFVRQLYTMLHTDLGYHTKDIISCRFLSFETMNKRYSSDEEWQRDYDEIQHKEQVIRQKMDGCPYFAAWQYGDPPIQLEPQTTVECNGEKHKMAITFASNGYMRMFGLKLKEGRMWNDKDQFAQYKMIINETARKLFRIEKIDEASLQTESRLWWSQGIDLGKNPPFQVVGVIEDFRTGHLSKGDAPLAILYEENGNPTDPLLATIVGGKRKEAIDFLKALHNEVLGEGEFEYSFVEDQVEKLYDDDKRTTRIYVTFAGLAICVSCLGLFGLSLYDIRQRYREIALRKVNGATGGQIALLLVRKYLYILGAAFVVAIPLVYYIINDYTKDFAVKAPIGVGIFVAGFILTSLISLGTLLWQVRKAVRINLGVIMKNE